MTQPKENKYLTIPELAKIFGLSRIAVYNKVRKGEIPAERVGRNFAIPRSFLKSIEKKTISKSDKAVIDRAVARTVREYGETLKLLGKE